MIVFPAGGDAFFEFRLFSAGMPLPRALRWRCSGIFSGIRYEFALASPWLGFVLGPLNFTQTYPRGIDGSHSSTHPPRETDQKAPLRQVRIDLAPFGHAV